MEKSKLGISVCLLGALVFLSGYTGLTVLALVAGYILLKEENATLKKYAVYAVVISLAFTLLSMCLGGLENLISIINFRSWMYDSTVWSIIRSIISMLGYILALAEKVILGLFAVCALFGKTIKIGVLDKFVEKHF